MVDTSGLFNFDLFDLSTCTFQVSNECYEAISNKNLEVVVSRIGRAKEKLKNIEVFMHNTSGKILLNFAAGTCKVLIENNVHGKFDFRLYRNSEVVVGRGTTSGSTSIFCKDSILKVGSDCMFSTGVTIQTSDQHGIVDIGQRRIVNNGPKKVIIGDHVWLGRFVTLTSGVEIGSGSVIGIGSVVTGKIPANVVAAGVPAKVLKENHTWCRSPDTFDEYSLNLINSN